jgi:hypothetical protein
MRQLSSSISSFEPPRTELLGHRGFRRRFLATLVWTIISIAILDVTIGLIFRSPPEPQAIPTTMQFYFDYGRSIEGKLRRMVGATVAQDAPIIVAGWIAHDCSRSISIPAGKLGIEIYGNSFTLNIAGAMEKLDPRLAMEHFGGPGAPPSHSYACFLLRNQTEQTRAPIQIFGVLASSLRRMVTISGLTTTFELPQPFTYPRYTIRSDGHLTPHQASIRSPEDLHAALADRVKWRAFVGELAAMDAFYAPEMMDANIADHSVLLRMVRRAWGQRLLRDRTASLHPETGFDGAPEIASVLRAILVDFADRARASGQRPIVVLFEDRGYGGVLSTMLAAELEKNHIGFVATGRVVDTDDPHNFVPDGHFTPAAFSEIARAALRLVNEAP